MTTNAFNLEKWEKCVEWAREKLRKAHHPMLWLAILWADNRIAELGTQLRTTSLLLNNRIAELEAQLKTHCSCEFSGGISVSPCKYHGEIEAQLQEKDSE